MMTKYTPGPWTFSRDIWWENTPGDQERHGGLIVWPAANEDLTIAEVNDFFDGDEGRANARLMAAAPELYEALKEYEKWETALILDDEVWAEGAMPRLTEELYDWMLRLQDMRIAAIEKAEGVPD